MSRPHRSFVDEPLLREVYGRPYEAEVAAVEAAVESWGYAKRGGAHHRTWVFQPHEGPVGSELIRQWPEQDAAAREIYGFDGQDRIVLTRGMDGLRLVEQATVRHEGDLRTGVTYMRDPDGKWAPEIAFYERYEHGQLVESGSYGMHAGLVGQVYHYDADGERVVERVERRSQRFADGSSERRLHMQYGEDGKPEVLTEGGSVVWRRRVGGKERRAALEAAETLLGRDLRAAFAMVSTDGAPAVVLLRHQDDGAWVDQALPEVAATSDLRAHAGGHGWEDAWWPDEWDVPSLPVRFAGATLRALEDLDATGTPIHGEARVLLRTVASRLLGEPPLLGRDVVVVVTDHDPEDFRADVIKSITEDQRQRLASLGWL